MPEDKDERKDTELEDTLVKRLKNHSDYERILDIIDARVSEKVDAIRLELSKAMDAKLLALCNACLPAKQIDEKAFETKMRIVMVAVIGLIIASLAMPLILHFSGIAVGSELWKIEYAIFAGVIGIVGIGILGMKPQQMIKIQQ